MMGLKALFAIQGVDETYFLEQNDVFRYGLWFKGADYSIYIEKFNNELLDITLYHFSTDIRPKRHVYMSFERFVEVFDKIEFKLVLNTTIPFRDKIKMLWEKLEAEGEKGEKNGQFH